ncbi:MAG: HU family DNA-binding protein [Bacteroidota bacterium]|nr:HU family DNA-binding protein [Bacteroidota bacterium]
MTHNEIVKELSLQQGKTQKEVRDFLNVLTKIILETLDSGKAVPLPGFGTFRTQLMKPRKTFNPNDRKYYMMPEKRVIHFSPCSSLKSNLPTNPL